MSSQDQLVAVACTGQMISSIEGRFPRSAIGVMTPLGGPRPAAKDLPTVARVTYEVAGLSSRTKMLDGSEPCGMAKNGNTAAPLEPSPS